jgi:hypothetical protein
MWSLLRYARAAAGHAPRRMMNSHRFLPLPSERTFTACSPQKLVSEAGGILLHFLQLLLFRNCRLTESIGERHILHRKRE